MQFKASREQQSPQNWLGDLGLTPLSELRKLPGIWLVNFLTAALLMAFLTSTAPLHADQASSLCASPMLDQQQEDDSEKKKDDENESEDEDEEDEEEPECD